MNTVSEISMKYSNFLPTSVFGTYITITKSAAKIISFVLKLIYLYWEQEYNSRSSSCLTNLISGIMKFACELDGKPIGLITLNSSNIPPLDNLCFKITWIVFLLLLIFLIFFVQMFLFFLWSSNEESNSFKLEIGIENRSCRRDERYSVEIHTKRIQLSRTQKPGSWHLRCMWWCYILFALYVRAYAIPHVVILLSTAGKSDLHKTFASIWIIAIPL